MGFFDFFSKSDINEGVSRFQQTEGALLLDVRTPEEYAEGHIPQSRNLPLQQIDQICSVAADKEKPVFVYCRSGARSGRAVDHMKQLGYRNAVNIGGIMEYQGPLE